MDDYLRAGCPHMPGSEEKIGVLAGRRLARVPLFRSDDAVLSERHGYVPAHAGRGVGHTHCEAMAAAAVVREKPGGGLERVGRRKKAPSTARPYKTARFDAQRRRLAA